MRETAERITEAVDGSEVGWTFVDEIVEQDGVVPESTNDWLLVDYGVIREGDTLRKLGWFNRQSGDVLALVGQATAPPSDLAEVEGGVNDPYDQFHVTLVAHDEESPQYLRTDVDLGDALDYVYEFLDADQADFRVIETGEETWIQDQITDEDINTGGTFRSLIPNLGYRTGDFVTLADSKARGTVNELGFWGPQLAKMAGYAVMYWAPKWAGDRLDGVEVDPFFNAKKKKVGVNFSKEYDERGGITTETETKFTVQPKAFFKLSERYAPKFVNYGLNEGDIGKGLVQTATERIDDIQHPSTVHQQWGKAFLDEFGGSVTTFLFTLRSGQRDYESELRDQRDEAQDNLSEELRAEFAADYFRMADSDFVDSPEDLIGRATWSDLPEEVKTDYREYIEDRTDEIDTEDMKWDDLSDDTLGISGMLMRGLDAETLVKGGKFFNVTQWLSGRLNRTGGTYTADWEPPSFEEWEQERFGPGQPPGPEAEARRRARYHKEVAGSSDAPDPYDELGVDEQTRRRINEQSDMAAETDETGLGDYDFYGVPHYIEDSFEGVADRLGGIDTVTDRFDADSEPEESRE